MLESDFVKPQTDDRIRACWTGAAIERCAGWLSEQGYSTRTALRRVLALVTFGEFARMRGSVPAVLPAHVDAFVAMRFASFRRAREAAAEIHGGIEQMLAVAPSLDIPASDIGNTYLSDGYVLLWSERVYLCRIRPQLNADSVGRRRRDWTEASHAK